MCLGGVGEGVRAAGFNLFDGVVPPGEPDPTLVQSWDGSVTGTGATSRRDKFWLEGFRLSVTRKSSIMQMWYQNVTFILGNLSSAAVKQFNPTMTDLPVFTLHTRFELRHFKLTLT